VSVAVLLAIGDTTVGVSVGGTAVAVLVAIGGTIIVGVSVGGGLGDIDVGATAQAATKTTATRSAMI
jgi:hypothetical protein